eukprot:m.399341 g.399341  ORF g.399341 m.399341 type:complete len:181 (-) comp56431_c0_seq4:42-584(-)
MQALIHAIKQWAANLEREERQTEAIGFCQNYLARHQAEHGIRVELEAKIQWLQQARLMGTKPQISELLMQLFGPCDIESVLQQLHTLCGDNIAPICETWSEILKRRIECTPDTQQLIQEFEVPGVEMAHHNEDPKTSLVFSIFWKRAFHEQFIAGSCWNCKSYLWPQFLNSAEEIWCSGA